jgi:hypothetical protein
MNLSLQALKTKFSKPAAGDSKLKKKYAAENPTS